jgi:hypothetical protein
MINITPVESDAEMFNWLIRVTFVRRLEKKWGKKNEFF